MVSSCYPIKTGIESSIVFNGLERRNNWKCTFLVNYLFSTPTLIETSLPIFSQLEGKNSGRYYNINQNGKTVSLQRFYFCHDACNRQTGAIFQFKSSKNLEIDMYERFSSFFRFPPFFLSPHWPIDCWSFVLKFGSNFQKWRHFKVMGVKIIKNDNVSLCT